MVRSVPGAWRAQGLDQAKMPRNCRRFGLVEFRTGTGASGQGRGLRLPISLLKPSFPLPQLPAGLPVPRQPRTCCPCAPGALTSSWLRPSWILGAVHRASLLPSIAAWQRSRSVRDLGVGADVAGVLARGGAGNNFSCATRRACQRLTLFFTKRRTFIS